MNTIKFYTKNEVPMAKINNKSYKGYTVGNLPSKFGIKDIISGDEVKPGISEWFKCKGLTFIEVKESFWNDVAKDYEQANVEMLFKSMN
jgi:hypothetical protein|tara:strand:- start:391 stop:657 length:267 start_codon:yes stop_codon:yes gene_type:complete